MTQDGVAEDVVLTIGALAVRLLYTICVPVVVTSSYVVTGLTEGRKATGATVAFTAAGVATAEVPPRFKAVVKRRASIMTMQGLRCFLQMWHDTVGLLSACCRSAGCCLANLRPWPGRLRPSGQASYSAL